MTMQKGSRYTTYKQVTLECDDPVDLTGSTKDAPVEFWFVIPATTFTQGLSFVVTDPEGRTFEKSTDKEIAVVRSHMKPLKTAVDFTASEKVVFADANFKAYCVENFDTDEDGEISMSEAGVVESISVNTDSISSLGGIEHFVNLKTLICQGSLSNGSYQGQLASLDVSQNTALTYLACYGNQLTSLDVSHNTALRTLLCYENQLTSLDVSQNTALTRLDCYQNQLTSLDVSQNTALRDFDCLRNQLTSLDVSHNTALKTMLCGDNQLTSLDVSHNTALTYLYCEYNQLTSLDVSHNTALTKLNCGGNQLTSLDVSQNTALTRLDCYQNQLTSLDVSQNTALEYLYCYGNQLTNLDVSHNTVLTKLRCGSNPQLTEIWLKTGQTIQTFEYDTSVATIKYKD